MNNKKEFRSVEPGKPLYVIAHGNWCRKRGKQLSAVLAPTHYQYLGSENGQRNPRKAYDIAVAYMKYIRSYKFRRSILYDDPLMTAYHEPPREGMQKVPFTCYNWY